MFRGIAKASLVLLAAGALALPALAKKSEQELVAQLSSKDEEDVMKALQGLEKEYPESATTREKVLQFLKDPREKVHRKAARVAGALHYDLTPEQLADVASLLASRDKDAVVDGLKALRGLRSSPAVPQIVVLLGHGDEHVKRDACRTLAAVGDASLIPQIEPLLKDSNKRVQEDARDAIARLKLK